MMGVHQNVGMTIDVFLRRYGCPLLEKQGSSIVMHDSTVSSPSLPPSSLSKLLSLSLNQPLKKIKAIIITHHAKNFSSNLSTPHLFCP